MNICTIDTITYYRLVLGFIGMNNEIPNSYSPETFESIEDATAYFNKNYRDRNKGDEYDIYWNSKPLVIQKIIQSTEFITNLPVS